MKRCWMGGTDDDHRRVVVGDAMGAYIAGDGGAACRRGGGLPIQGGGSPEGAVPEGRRLHEGRHREGETPISREYSSALCAREMTNTSEDVQGFRV